MVIFSSTVVEKHTSLNSKENIISKIAPQHLGGGIRRARKFYRIDKN